MKRAIGAVAGLTLGAAGWLTAVPLVQYACLQRLRKQHPELFQPAAALQAVNAAITQDTE